SDALRIHTLRNHSSQGLTILASAASTANLVQPPPSATRACATRPGPAVSCLHWPPPSCCSSPPAVPIAVAVRPPLLLLLLLLLPTQIQHEADKSMLSARGGD